MTGRKRRIFAEVKRRWERSNADRFFLFRRPWDSPREWAASELAEMVLLVLSACDDPEVP